MLDLLIAIDLEVKYRKWRLVDRDVDHLTVMNPKAMRRLFVIIYKLMPGKLLMEYEVRNHERKLATVEF